MGRLRHSGSDADKHVDQYSHFEYLHFQINELIAEAQFKIVLLTCMGDFKREALTCQSRCSEQGQRIA